MIVIRIRPVIKDSVKCMSIVAGCWFERGFGRLITPLNTVGRIICCMLRLSASNLTYVSVREIDGDSSGYHWRFE